MSPRTKSVVLQSSKAEPSGIGVQVFALPEGGKDTWLLACVRVHSVSVK
jgi:hypothetical protein